MVRRLMPKKDRKMKMIMKMRNSEKSAEFFEKAWRAFETKQTASGIRLLFHATTIYGAKFNAILIELNAAKHKGFLPKDFQMPKNQAELKKLFEQHQNAL